jgi:hypothetical protein
VRQNWKSKNFDYRKNPLEEESSEDDEDYYYEEEDDQVVEPLQK